ncbi:MAG: Gldg family protein [Vicinamibacterales bacterium]
MKRILGIVGWLGVAFVVAAVIIRVSRPELFVWSQRLAIAGLITTGLYALSQWRDVGRSFGGRNVKYGSVAVTTVVLILAIIVGINWVASRHNKRWDLTAASQFSLSDQTRRILADLKTPVAMHLFYTRSADEYRDRLSEYTYLSKQVSVEYVDAERNPVVAHKYGIQTVPTLVIEYGGRTEKASAIDEQSVTNALKKVIAGKAKKLYFMQGHGEHDVAASSPDGYSTIADALKNDNFETDKLTLAQTGSVPADASVVVIAGPRTDLLAPEADALRKYLGTGGKVQLLIDPPEKSSTAQLTNLLALAQEWGITVGNNIVIDASGLGQLLGTDASVPVAMPVQHAITQNFRVMTAFPLARSVVPVEGGTNGRVAQKILETSPQSWAESDVAGLYSTGRPERNLDKGDVAGPVAIAAAVSGAAPDAATNAPADAPKAETRMVVVGDSDFASNRAIGLQGNREIFLNMANWLAQQEDLIAIRPRNAEDRPITMTADQGLMVKLLTQVLVPAMLLGYGIRVWWRRR